VSLLVSCYHLHVHPPSSFSILIVKSGMNWLQVSLSTETFADLSLSVTGDDNIHYINTRLSCNALVLRKHQPQVHVFVSHQWLWWIISKIIRQVIDVISISI